MPDDLRWLGAMVQVSQEDMQIGPADPAMGNVDADFTRLGDKRSGDAYLERLAVIVDSGFHR
jgi:hypothetical protein